MSLFENIFDIVFILCFVSFSLYGFFKGFIDIILKIVVFVIGIQIILIYYGEIIQFLQKYIPFYISDTIFTVIIVVSCYFLGRSITKIFHSFFPFIYLSIFNRLLGLIAGAVLSIIIITVLYILIGRYVPHLHDELRLSFSFQL